MWSTRRGRDGHAIPGQPAHPVRKGFNARATAVAIGAGLVIASCTPPPSPTDTSAAVVAECPELRSRAMSDAELAFEVRRLQSSLMVAALTCKARPEYNSFVKAHQKSLQHNAHTLKQEFHRRHGRAGEREMNKFITRLANEESARSNANRSAFCSEASTVFRSLHREPNVSLPEYVVAISGSSPHTYEKARSCRVARSGDQASKAR